MRGADPAVRLPVTGRRAYGNLKDDAAGYIRDAIVSGRFPPGAKVDQDEIAAALGFSKAPVREALIELAQKGFVVAIPRRGAFVAQTTVEDVEDHYAVVAVVFGMTTRRAVPKLTASQVTELHALDSAMTTTEDAAELRSLDRRFFDLIVNAGRSSRLDSILSHLGGALQGSFYYETSGWVAHEQVFRARLLEAIDARDARGAAKVSEDHLRSCAGLTIDHLRSIGHLPAP